MLRKKITVDVFQVFKETRIYALGKEIIFALIFNSFGVTMDASNELIKRHLFFPDQPE
jgi:hypothetical protein